jgi:hypothetical protein|tara:strand:- start:411 stop:596 length:186 start_codon:yes stop_codon:yes gene_type:complete
MDFIKDKIYFLPKLNCKIRFIEKANTTYSIDFFDFRIITGTHWSKIIRVLKSEVQNIKEAA